MNVNHRGILFRSTAAAPSERNTAILRGRCNLTLIASCCLLLASAALAEDIPLPEHPRPDWERAEWLNLNGHWDFGFKPGKLDQRILVPYGWAAPASGVKGGGETGYYRRTVTVPEAWKGKRVFVVVGASDHDTTCTFDGETLGLHSGGYTPFEFELTGLVRWGEEQTLEFKVWDPPQGKAMGGHYLYGKQPYGNARGIWQTVYLEARSDVFLDSVRFTPSIAGKSVACRAFLDVPAKSDGTLSVEVAGKTFTAAVKPMDMVVDLAIPIAEPHLWSLDDPYLYDVTVKLAFDKQVSKLSNTDTVRSYFGFREIGMGKNPNGDTYVTLNGKPVYLQLCLDQSFHPTGLYTFPSDEFMKNDMLLTKKLALTGNRIHIKVDIPRRLYWADKLGVLIQADVPNSWGPASEAMFEEHWKCFGGMVKRDYNHPCIYQWTLFNETWGLFNSRLQKPAKKGAKPVRKPVYCTWTQRKVAEAYYKAKLADPTRLVEDNSPNGGNHVITDVNSWHGYGAGHRWSSYVEGNCRGTKPGNRNNHVSGHVQGDVPMMNSECGNVWGYRGSTGDCDYTWDYHLMMNAFRSRLKCAGWLYTEHHDMCNEWNGYVRFDRSPKYDGFDELAGMTVADLHRDAAVTLLGELGKETGEVLAPGQEMTIPVGVSFITEKYADKGLTLRTSGWYFDGEGRKVNLDEQADFPKGTGRSWQCEKLWDVPFAAPKEPACGCRVFVLSADGKEIARNFWSFAVTNGAPKAIAASKAEWSMGATNVLAGLKLNGFGKGCFEFTLDAPAEGGVFRAEIGAKRKNAKDIRPGEKLSDLDYMHGAGMAQRSANVNSYPQTSDEKYPSELKVYANGALVKTMTLPDDPADSRGILSWLAQRRDGYLREAGSYGFLVEADVPASAVKDGKVVIRLEADRGIAVYGPFFGRYPFGPHVR